MPQIVAPEYCRECGYDRAINVGEFNGKYLEEYCVCPMCGFHHGQRRGYGAFAFAWRDGEFENGVFHYPITDEDLAQILEDLVDGGGLVLEDSYLVRYSREEGHEWVLGSPARLDTLGSMRNKRFLRSGSKVLRGAKPRHKATKRGGKKVIPLFPEQRSEKGSREKC